MHLEYSFFFGMFYGALTVWMQNAADVDDEDIKKKQKTTRLNGGTMKRQRMEHIAKAKKEALSANRKAFISNRSYPSFLCSSSSARITCLIIKFVH